MRSLLRYWQSLSEAGRLPSRQSLHLEGLIRHLPHITLVDILSASQWRMRLVGSRARDLLGLVAESRAVDVRGNETLKALRPSIIEKCLASGHPQYGIDVSPCGKVLHAWVRLPLASDGKTPDAVLGFDQTLQAETIAAEPVRPRGAFLNPASAGSHPTQQTFVA